MLQHLQNFCDLITLNSAGVPTAVLAPYYNLSSVDLSGIDLQASYRIPLAGLWSALKGDSLAIGFSGSYVSHVFVNAGLGGPTVDRAGELGPNNPFAMPHFRSTTSVTYSAEHFSLMAEARTVSGGVLRQDLHTPHDQQQRDQWPNLYRYDRDLHHARRA